MPQFGPTQPGQYLDVPVFNALFPSEGGKAVPVVLDFSKAQSYSIDLSFLQQQGYIKLLQGLFFDNTQNNAPVVVQINGTNQNLKLPPNSQGYLPAFFMGASNQAGTLKFNATCTGGAVATLIWTNVPLPAVIWGATGNFTFTSSGYLQVSDVALDACISGNSLATTVMKQQNNNVLKPDFAADELFTGSTTSTAAQTIMTGNPSFFIKELVIKATGNATTGTGGVFMATLKDGATAIATGQVFLPAAAPTTATPNYEILTLRNLNYNSKANANALTLTFSGVLTSGVWSWEIAGGICSNVGP